MSSAPEEVDGCFSVLFSEDVLDTLQKSFIRFHRSTQLGLSRKAPIFPAVSVGKPASKFNEILRNRNRLLLCGRIELRVEDLSWTATVYFFETTDLTANFLGRTGWLDRVLLGLNHYEQQMYLSPTR